MKTIKVYVPYDDGDSYHVGELTLPETLLTDMVDACAIKEEDPILVFDRREDGSIDSVEIKFPEESK